MSVSGCALVAESCPALCNPTDCSLPVSSVHGLLQARILEWVAISFFPALGLNPGLLHCRQILYPLSHQRSPVYSFIYMAVPGFSCGARSGSSSLIRNQTGYFYFSHSSRYIVVSHLCLFFKGEEICHNLV